MNEQRKSPEEELDAIQIVRKQGGPDIERISETPDFAILFTTGVYKEIIEKGGLTDRADIAARNRKAARSARRRRGWNKVSDPGIAENRFNADLVRASKRIEANAVKRYGPKKTKTKLSLAPTPRAEAQAGRVLMTPGDLRVSQPVGGGPPDLFVGDSAVTLPGVMVTKADLPETLYHVSGAPDIAGVKLLRPSGDAEFGGGGLGGGADKSRAAVSLTRSREKAELIQRELIRHGEIARGEVGGDFVNWLRNKVMEDAQAAGISVDKLTPHFDDAVADFRTRSGFTGANARQDSLDSYRLYLASRRAVESGALENPIIFVPNLDKLRHLTADSVKILEVPRDGIPDAALIRNISGLDETAVHADVPLGTAPTPRAEGGVIETVQQMDPNMNDNGTIKRINENATERNKQIARGEIEGEKLSENQKKKYSLAAGQPNFGGSLPSILAKIVTLKKDQTLFEKVSTFMNKENRSDFLMGLRMKAVNQYEKAGWMDQEVAKKTGNDAYLMAAVSSMSSALNSDKVRGMFTYALEKGVPVLRRGIVNGVEYSWVTMEPFEIRMPDGSMGKGGIRTILTPLFARNQNLYTLWSGFMIARREHRFASIGKETRTTPEERAEIFKEVGYDPDTKSWRGSKYPNIELVANNYQAWNDKFVEFMVDTGVFSRMEADVFKSYSDYIPFYRQFDGESNIELDEVISGIIGEEQDANGVRRKASPPMMFHALAGVQGPKAAKGGETKVDDPLENILQNAFAGLQAGAKNLASQKVMDQALELGLAEPSDTQGDSSHTLRRDGVDTHYKVHDHLVFEVLSGVMDGRMPWLDMLAIPSQFLRELITRSPDFLAANLLRDTGSAWVTSGADFTPFVGALNNMFSGDEDPRWEALERAGLASGFENMNNPEDFRKHINKQWKREGLGNDEASDTWKFFDKIWTGSGKLSTRSDMSVRMEVWEDVVNRMESEGIHDRAIIEAEADFQASETMNFGRRGSSPLYRILTALVPFTGAHIQGLDVLYRSVRGRYGTDYAAVQSGAALMRFKQRALMVLSLTGMYWLLMHDDDDYTGVTDAVRDMNVIIPSSMVPGDEPLKLPKPFEIGFLLITVPEAFLTWMFDDEDNRRAMGTLKRGLLATLPFNPIPQAGKPMLEAIANHSFWTDRNIVPEHQLGLNPALQYSRATGEFSRLLGATFGASPAKIEHVIRGYTGTLGSYGLFLVDEATRSMSDFPSRPPLELSDLPMFRRFFGKPGGGNRGDLERFYDLRKASHRALDSWRKLRREGRHDEAKKLKEDRQGIFKTRSRVLSMDRRVSALRKKMERIYLSKDLPEEKARKLESNRQSLESALRDLDKLRKESDLPMFQ